MRHLLKKALIFSFLFSFLALMGYAISAKAAPTHSNTTPAAFLKSFNLKVEGQPDKFNVTVPRSWDVNLGEYPVGLYWRLANAYSKDAGLDMTPLKGKTVAVWRYSLSGGLPGQGEQSVYKYPSNAVLLVNSNKVVGAWLAFNCFDVGPSVKKRYIKDITGLSFEDWTAKEGLFSNPGKNSDLSSLDPAKLLDAYFKAISSGDKKRAYACLGPTEMLGSLTMNLGPRKLYNTEFNSNNSMTENIEKAVMLNYQFMDNKTMKKLWSFQVKRLTEVEAAVTLDIKWRNSYTGPSSNGEQTKYAVLRKYKNGWKLLGLGTGP